EGAALAVVDAAEEDLADRPAREGDPCRNRASARKPPVDRLGAAVAAGDATLRPHVQLAPGLADQEHASVLDARAGAAAEGRRRRRRAQHTSRAAIGRAVSLTEEAVHLRRADEVEPVPAEQPGRRAIFERRPAELDATTGRDRGHGRRCRIDVAGAAEGVDRLAPGGRVEVDAVRRAGTCIPRAEAAQRLLDRCRTRRVVEDQPARPRGGRAARNHAEADCDAYDETGAAPPPPL